MPRMQVYLPDDLYRAVKDRGLPASDLLRRAVQAELRRQRLLEETARYVDELVAEVGPPDDAAMAKAEAVADQVRPKCSSKPVPAPSGSTRCSETGVAGASIPA